VALKVNGITHLDIDSEEHRVKAETGFQLICRKNATYLAATPSFLIREFYILTYKDYKLKF